MPAAICQNCGKEIHYRNPRGTKLAAMRCDACGGGLKQKRNVAKPGGNKGKTIGTCGICGSRKYKLSRIDVPMRSKNRSQETVYNAGTMVCGQHYLLPADHDFFRDPTAWWW